MIFLDANAGMPALPEARAAFVRALDVVGNPSSPHALGRAARAILDEARAHVARALGAEAREVTFTSGASEANRWLVDAVAHLPGETNVVTSVLEHPSLAKPLAAFGETAAPPGTSPGATLRVVRFFDVASDDAIADADVLFVTAAHNETGLLPSLPRILERVKPTCIVCVDAAQAVARLPVEALPKRVDAIVASAHKIGGYAGAGALVLRGNARALRARWLGGGQEGGLRPGTEALALHAAFGAAAAVVDDTRARHAALAPLRDRIERALVDAWGARAVGTPPDDRLPNTTALVVSGVDGDALRIAIDGAGVAVGFGSACSAMAPEPSPALRALGLCDEDARSTVRLSLAPTTTERDVDEAIARLVPLRTLVERSRARRGRQR